MVLLACSASAAALGGRLATGISHGRTGRGASSDMMRKIIRTRESKWNLPLAHLLLHCQELLKLLELQELRRRKIRRRRIHSEIGSSARRRRRVLRNGNKRWRFLLLSLSLSGNLRLRLLRMCIWDLFFVHDIKKIDLSFYP